MNSIPAKFESAFWSYNIKELDLGNDKDLIITQLLNYGDLDAVRWVVAQYGTKGIGEVVKKPRRGLWHKRTLNYWREQLS